MHIINLKQKRQNYELEDLNQIKFDLNLTKIYYDINSKDKILIFLV